MVNEASQAKSSNIDKPKSIFKSFSSILFGYDFFNSFKLGPPPTGAQSYASDMARRLRERDFSVFFSEEVAAPGKKLDSVLIKALHRSRILVVIANDGALLESKWVPEEVVTFRKKHPKRPVVPINVDGAMQKNWSHAKVAEWFGYQW